MSTFATIRIFRGDDEEGIDIEVIGTRIPAAENGDPGLWEIEINDNRVTELYDKERLRAERALDAKEASEAVSDAEPWEH